MVTTDRWILGLEEEKRIRLFNGPFQLSSILARPQRPLVVCIIAKYVHSMAVLLRHCIALGHAHRHILQPEVQELKGC